MPAFHAGKECFVRIMEDPQLIKKMFDLQLLDAITGQADRHAANYFIDVEGHAVWGIDNDQCAGELVRHPNYLIYAQHGVAELDPELERHPNGVLLKDAKDVLKESAGSAVRGVWLPPVMDHDQIASIKRLTGDEVESCMRDCGLSGGGEISSAKARLQSLKQHINVLEIRQENGHLSIIDPNDWALQTTRDRLIPQTQSTSQNITLNTNYLQRDVAIWAY
ncbi:hypothetical protein IAG25_39950 [Caballeronia sp. EK]|uniref:hypothetical protein n=1 Tax=Caballeronia sp. EK TaxID=2767469 RepID=UPI001654E5C1|nr:hypothetical protein [Caballeronia sp. EK]MBC8642941.1 hypothetical protein [Caballeronia sp. EK]